MYKHGETIDLTTNQPSKKASYRTKKKTKTGHIETREVEMKVCDMKPNTK